MIHLSCLTVLPLVNLQMRIPVSESFLLYAQNIRFSSNISSSVKPDERPTTSFFLMYPIVSTDPADEDAVNWVIHSVHTEYLVIQQFFKNSGNQLRCWQILFFFVYLLVNAVIRMLVNEVFFCPRGKFWFISSFSRILKKLKKDRRFL